MLNHLSTRHGRACPGHPDYLAPGLMIGVTGDISAFTRVFDALCPAMTRLYVLIRPETDLVS